MVLKDSAPSEALEWLESNVFGHTVDRDDVHVYSVREANSKVSEIANLALKGSPQFIQKRGKELVVLMSVKSFRGVPRAAQRPKPGASFYDLLPVATGEAPPDFDVELKIQERPGRETLKLDLA